jgi:hypothetical protein
MREQHDLKRYHGLQCMPAEDPFSYILAHGRRDSRDPALRLAKPDLDAAPGAAEELDSRQYRAFETGPKPARLIIQCSRGPSHSPAYGMLVNVIFDRVHYSSAVLVYHALAVTVIGRNLASVVHAINHHRASAITEFDTKTFDPPAAGDPVIERIEIQAGKTMEGLTDGLPRPVRA